MCMDYVRAPVGKVSGKRGFVKRSCIEKKIIKGGDSKRAFVDVTLIRKQRFGVRKLTYNITRGPNYTVALSTQYILF